LNDKRKDFSLEYAGFWIRLVAALIDLTILVISLYVLYCVISQSLFWIFPDIQTIGKMFSRVDGATVAGPIIWLVTTMSLLLLIGSTIYFVVCWAMMGQTPGKLSVGIKIIRSDNSPMDLRCAFMRFLGCILCVLTLGIGFIILAFDSHKQGLHDRIAGTYVVKMPVKQVLYDRTLVRGGIS
jgi:uncharacterized RDD family membrane protein YckC